MTHRVFDLDYREEAILRGGQRVLFRLVRPEDKAALARGLSEMSPESRYRRFFTHREHLSQAELSYLTELDHEHHFALGVGTEVGGAPRGLGIARFVRLDAPEIAEAAVAVIDEMHGMGLGRMLFERLIRAAQERDIAIFRFEVLGGNDEMLGLIRKLFPSGVTEAHDGILSIDCPLPSPEDHGHALFDLFALAARDLVRVLGGRTRHGPGRHTRLADLIGLQRDDGPAPT
jgi:GNAT superfamily N-acetyltransferase